VIGPALAGPALTTAPALVLGGCAAVATLAAVLLDPVGVPLRPSRVPAWWLRSHETGVKPPCLHSGGCGRTPHNIQDSTGVDCR
jgi:hypothetical protein